ncbi:MAG: ATP-dependent metallopeptidase FtsH/Yme1/Tma family protein, partial [Clostridia bacterium]|nr:ATP-dependent metallopeptidase FtsH/Yme1/Tma family protein [Clostridia bacterium]
GTGIEISYDPLLAYAIIYAEGGVADARTVKGKSGAYIYNELYELFRLMQSDKNGYDVAKIKRIDIKLELPDDLKIVSLFNNSAKPSVLLFADGVTADTFKQKVTKANVFVADDISAAEKILAEQEISAVFVDVTCRIFDGERHLLNIEDVQSAGREFMYYAAERVRAPMYVVQGKEGDISEEEYASLASVGTAGLISLDGGKDVNTAVSEACRTAYQQKNLNALARANKVLSHKTLQSVSDDGESVTIGLFDFKLTTALDAGDTNGVLDGVSKPKVKFSDVIGASDAKEELTYFIDYLKNSSKFIKRGVRAPKGILLYGPPGTGKTLLAKAMAGESDVTFIRAEGNQFLKKYVGEGSESVHKLFTTARKYAPSILFIDEIDAIGKGRGGDNNRSDDVLTSFLTEMDGFNTDNDRPVFVLAATNYDIEQGTSRSLDAALLRRFDRKIYVDLPNREERKQFIKLKLSKVRDNKITPEQIENLAVRSTGTSLADLDSVFELAVRNVIKSEDLALTDKVLEEAFETFNSGDVKKWNESELLRTARHEAGHALICYLGGETPSYLTIVARGSHGGYMQHADAEGKGTYTKHELLSRVRTALGGRAAEVVYYGDEDGVSTGASGDLSSATAIIENMICRYGMDETVGMGSVDLQKIVTSPHYAQIVSRINELLAREFAFVKRAVEDNRAAIDKLVEVLLQKNALKANEIEEILENYVK